MTAPPASDERYLSYAPRILRDWAGNLGVPHQRVDASMVFIDLSGFTSMTERLSRTGKQGAEEVSDIISSTFASLLAHAYGYGGSLLKFGGDALLLLFDEDDHALRAAAAGAEMRLTLREVGKCDTSVGLVTLRMTGGIHSGLFDLFLVGSTQRELIVGGPAASRLVSLEGSANTGEIIISDETASRLPSRSVSQRSDGALRLARAPEGVGTTPITPHEAAGSLESIVPPAVRRRIADGDVDPEHRYVTISFIGFRGLDRMAAEDPAEAAAELGSLVSDVSTAVEAHGAWLLSSDVDVDGGKLVLVAGAPVATGYHDRDLLLAVHAALEPERRLAVRAGINNGTVFFGDVGPDFRQTLTVMGDTVNVAARLMGAAAPGQVVAAGSVLAASDVAFETGKTEHLSVKGKKRPIEAVRVGKPIGRTERTDEAKTLIGRESELEILAGYAADVEGGAGRAVAIVAEPGMGRSLLLEEMCNRCTAVPVIYTEASSLAGAAPYASIRPFLADAIGVDPDADDAGSRLTELAAAVNPALEEWIPLIAVPLSIEMPETEAVSALEPRFRTTAMHDRVGELLTGLLVGPRLLAFDDVEAMDPASQAVVGHLAKMASDRPWLVTVTARNVEDAEWADGVDFDTVVLGPLDRKSAIDTVKAMTQDQPLAPHEIDQLVDRAAGNPLFLHELVEAVQDGLAVDALPRSVEGAVAAKIDGLPADARRLVRTGAVLGPAFDATLLDEVAGAGACARMEAEPGLDDIIERDVEGRYRFANPVMRDVAYERLPYSTRLELHSQVADALATREEEAAPDLVAFHASRAHRWPEAHKAAKEAAERADTQFANVQAIELYRTAVDAGRKSDVDGEGLAILSERIGDLNERIGKYRDADEAYRDARALTGDNVVQARLMLQQARMQVKLDRYPQALSWLTRGRHLLRGDPRRVACEVRSILMAQYAGVKQRQGRYDDVISWAGRTLEERAVAPEARALAESMADWARTATGRAEDHSGTKQALAIYERLHDLEGQATTTNNLGMYAYFEGDWTAASKLYGQGRKAFLKMGDPVSASYGAANEAEILVDQGHFEEAERLFDDALPVIRAADHRVGEAFVLGHKARIAAATGRIEESLALNRAAHEIYDELGATEATTEIHYRYAECLLMQGHASQAMTFLEDAGLTSPEAQTAQLSALAHRVMGTAERQLGNRVEAARYLQAALDAARQISAEYEETLVLQELTRFTDTPTDEHERYDTLVRRFALVALPYFPEHENA